MLYSLNVGNDFHFGFFKRNKNCCYSKEKGLLYTDDVNNFKKLGLNPEDVKEIILDNNCEILKDDKIEKENIIELLFDKLLGSEKSHKEEINKMFSNFSMEIEKLNNKNQILEHTIKELVEIQKDNQELESNDRNSVNETFDVLKNSVSLLNKKIKNCNEQNLNLQTKFEALIEIFSEQKAIQANLPDLDALTTMNLKKIWKTLPDKNMASLFSLMLMGKKLLEEKGMRL